MRPLAVIAILGAASAAPAAAQGWPGGTVPATHSPASMAPRWVAAPAAGNGIAAAARGDAGATLAFACERGEEAAGLAITLQLPSEPGPRLPPRLTAMLGVRGEVLPLPLTLAPEGEAGGLYHFTPRTAGGFRQARAIARAISGPSSGQGGDSFTLQLPGRPGVEHFPLAEPGLVFATVVQPCGAPYRHAAAMVAGQANPRLIGSLWLGANLRCRAEGEASGDACDERAAYRRRLVALGWCLGRQGEAPGQMQWHACGPGSLRE